jgi:hypothetical protein
MLTKKILSTKGTPEISLDPDGTIKIIGRSMLENAAEFSEQTEDWINEYICNPAELTSVDIYLEYFNIINFKNYYSLLKKIGSVALKNKKFIINWYYEEGDEDILEKGEYISTALNMPFNFVMVHDPLMYRSESLECRTVEIRS